MSMSKTVTVTANKPEVGSTIGISLNYYDGGKIVVRSIYDHSIFYNTVLKAGFVLQSVNGTSVKGISTGDAMKLFTEAAAGDITIVAEDVGLRIASFAKDASNTKVGIGLKERYGGIVISSITDDSLMAGKDVKVGHLLLGVNGTCCKGLTPKQAISLFKGLDAITVLAQEIGLTSVIIHRADQSTKVGIGLKEIDGNIIISSLSKEGLFHGTAIKPGQRLVSVGKTDVEGMNKNEAIALFKKAIGSVTVVTDDIGLVAVSVHKDTPTTKLGIGLNTVNGVMVFSGISADGLFANTELKEGMRLVSVNNALVEGMTKAEAIDLFKKASGDIFVLAEDVGFATITVTKDSPSAKVGIGLKDMFKSVVISSISADGLFSNSGLKIGHKVVSVNKVNCLGMDKRAVINLFKEAESTLMVMIEDIGLIGATVNKTGPETKVGIGLKDVNGDVYISSIYEGGLFAKTDLKEDLKLVSVNRTNVAGMSKNDAIKLFKEAQGEITVMAMIP
jgi:C-terminal processing protease CtpA/Prc